MGASTAISWCDDTYNPWWGCQRVSPGCESCYAEAFSHRVGHGKRLPTIWGPQGTSVRKFFGAEHWDQPLRWNASAGRTGLRRRVFCASMADVFEDRPELVEQRARLFRLIEETTRLDWLLLTKRPENVRRLATQCAWVTSWPENVWLGVTVESQKYAELRLPLLADVDGPSIKFVSYEPALGFVDFGPYLPGIDWLIIGGESGAGARPFDLQWARSVIRQCRTAGSAPFMKQIGARPHDGPRLLKTRARKGDNPSEWPAELVVQEFPSCP